MKTENKELFEKRIDIQKEMDSIISNARNEKRGMTPDEEAKFDALNVEDLSIEKTINASEKMEQRRSSFENTIEKGAIDNKMSKDEFEDQTKRNFEIQTKFFKFGHKGLNDEERQILSRAQTSGTDSEGGYTVDSMIADEIVKSLQYYGGVRQVAKIYTTASGGDLQFPTNNDIANVGALLTEAAQGSEVDTVFGQKVLSAYMYYSKVVTISTQLLQDSAFNIAQYISEDLFRDRIGRAINSAYTNGTGSSQPEGVLYASTVGAVAAGDDAITYNDILELKHGVNSAYRNNAHFMFNDSTLLALKKLNVGSADARPLWSMGMADGTPATIDGTPYVINDDMPSIAAGKHPILFGDFSKFAIRDVQGYTVKRSDERYFEYLKTGFVAYMRTDSKLLDTGAIKFLRMSNT